MAVVNKNVLPRKSGWVKNNYLKTFVVVCFLTLLVSVSYLAVKLRKEREDSNSGSSVDEGVEDYLVWVNYENSNYGFSFDRPKFLEERVVEDSGEYEFFVKFIETDFSTAKGIAVGVRKEDLDEEVTRLKEELEGNFDVKLISEQKINIDGRDAVRLDYEPEDKEGFESRSLVIINKGEYSISISTVPEQIERLIESLKY